MKLSKMKNPVNHRVTGFMVLNDTISVEPEGFEPSSKQAITKLSTCVVFIWFSMHDRPKTAYRTLSFLKF